MEVKGKKVLVFGLGISGIGAGQILERHGAEVIMYDGNQKLTEEKIKKQLGEDSSAKIVIGDFPEEVLEKLDMTKIAESGEAVLLSPACASWDMFPSYEVRGEKFKEIVNSL